MNRSRSGLVFVLCTVYSLIAGLYPFEFFDRTPFYNLEFPWGFLTAVFVPIKDVGLSDFLQNILCFVPWGAIYYIFTASPNRRPHSLVLLAALVGTIVSVAIEICQIFFSRDPSVFDVLANTLGAGIGASLCAFSPIDVRRVVARSLVRAEPSQLLLPASLLLGIVPLLISVSKFPWTDFHNWDRGFALQIANEASLNRPWLGKIYLVAIYDRALAPEEIVRNFQLGASNEAMGSRVNRGLIALYAFTEGHGTEVRDVSGYRRPLDLTLSQSSHFRWLGQGNGLEVIQPAVLTSGRPADKLYDALNTSGELSVEVWITPANVKQKGPARIVSFSRDPVARNFTVGQDGADIDFRLRTPVSGTNGTAVNLRTQDGFLTGKQTHLIATYRNSVEKLYVDGREHPDKVDLKKANIIVAFGSKKNPLAKVAYSFSYFFPVSVCLSWVLSKKSASYLIALPMPAIIAVSLLSMAEGFQSYTFARPVDLFLVGCGAVVGMVGALCGASFAKETAAFQQELLSSR